MCVRTSLREASRLHMQSSVCVRMRSRVIREVCAINSSIRNSVRCSGVFVDNQTQLSRVLTFGVGPIDEALEFFPASCDPHQPDDRVEVLSESRMPDFLCQPLMVPGFAIASVILRILLFEFMKNPGGQPR